MNIKEAVLKSLTDNGLSDNDAFLIYEYAQGDDLMDNMRGRWLDAHDYDPGFTRIIINTVNSFAFEWIMENQPKAWYAPLFCHALEWSVDENSKREQLDMFSKVRREVLNMIPPCQNKGRRIYELLTAMNKEHVHVKVDPRIAKGFGR